jgi:hypothetical protein
MIEKKQNFDIGKYLKENKISLGSVEKAVGDTQWKGGNNDIRKTNYDVKLDENGKLDMYTQKKVITEAVSSPKDGKLSDKQTGDPKIKIILDVDEQSHVSRWLVAKCFAKGDAHIMIKALNDSSPSNYKYSIGK